MGEHRALLRDGKRREQTSGMNLLMLILLRLARITGGLPGHTHRHETSSIRLLPFLGWFSIQYSCTRLTNGRETVRRLSPLHCASCLDVDCAVETRSHVRSHQQWRQG